MPIMMHFSSTEDSQFSTLSAPTSPDPTNFNSSAGDYNISSTQPPLTDDQKLTLIREHIWPKPYMWFLIGCHIAVFVSGLVGNALVCLAVCRNRVCHIFCALFNQAMRTVTNILIVNLALADFLVLLVCLPPTVVADVTQTWFLGAVGCRGIYFLQMVSVAVSVLTLTFISMDRWYALCYPLRFHKTTGWAKRAIVLIWTTSILIGTPYLFYMQVVPNAWSPVDTVYFSSCVPSWGRRVNLAVALIWAVLLYLLPLLFMVFTYTQIIGVLWNRPVPGHPIALAVNSATGAQLSGCSGSVYVQSRRKAAKMLVIVVVAFAVCLLFVHVVIMVRAAVPDHLAEADETVGKLYQAAALISHWMLYFNSAVNPLIYNFMSSKFRREFSRAMCTAGGIPGARADTEDSRTNRGTHSLAERWHSRIGTKTSTLGHRTRHTISLQANRGTPSAGLTSSSKNQTNAAKHCETCV